MTERQPANRPPSSDSTPIFQEGRCPSLKELSRLLSGTADSHLSVAMQTHLDVCDQCVQTLDELLRGLKDPILEALRHPTIADVFLAETNCQDVVRIIAQPPFVNHEERAPESERFPTQIGSYQLVDKIAEGGMGVVFRAVHLDFKKIVAVKLLSPSLPHAPTIVRRFRRECRTLGQLQHPNLVSAFDAGVHDGTPYLVMEYVEGIDLAKLLLLRGSLSVSDASEIIRQAAMGLEHAWRKGIVHRDVKPSNMMLARHDRGQSIVKVLDLGLARIVKSATRPLADDSNLTSDGQIMGTRAYMAPEQARDSHDVDTRADVYSLGATLHELLVGQPPVRTAARRMDLTLLERAVPPGLVELMQSLLAIDRAHRPASPGTVAERLAPFAQGHRVDALL